MLAYAPFEPEEQPQPQPPPPMPNRQGIRPRHRGFIPVKGETECTYLILFFIFGLTILSVRE